MPRILSLSPTAVLPKPYPHRLHIPGGRVPKHELYLDLSSLEDKGWLSGPGQGPPPPGFFDLPSTRADWLPSIQEAIANHKDIDAVNIHRCNSTEWPSPELWKALSGGRPTHLELNAGAMEECDYEGLKDVEPAWPLKSLYLQCCEGDGERDWEGERGPGGPQWFKPSFPACYAGMETLVLHYALDSLYFYPEGGARNLRSLTVMESNFVATFARTVHCNPLTLQTLRSVTLGGEWFIEAEKWHVERMKDFFLNAKALVNIELALNDAKPFGFGEGTGDGEGSAISDEYPEDGDPATSTPQSPSPYLGPSDVLSASLTSSQHLEDDDAPTFQSPSPYLVRLSDVPSASRASNEHPEDEDEATSRSPSPYLGLTDVLPASLTSLSFRGPANKLMLDDLDSWIRNAKRAAWLPNLRTVALKLDLPCHLESAALDEAAQKELDAKVREFLGLLAKRNPAVQVVEPRTVKEMEYPLEF